MPTTLSPVTIDSPPFDLEKIRADFPILNQTINGKPLVYLDNAASSQKPRQVIEAISQYYLTSHANVHRGIHTLSQRATDLYEAAREKVRVLLNARSSGEIIFVRGATEAINLVAHSFGHAHLQPGDEILVTEMEHHANIVPWQMIAAERGAKVIPVPMSETGELIMSEFYRLISPKTKMVAVVHVSNALGTINPVAEIIAEAKRRGIATLVDGCQTVPHQAVDVQALGADFFAFSGHKIYAPTGIGILYGREEILSQLPPYQGGGDMIDRVSFSGTTYNDLPFKFEAGTPDIAGAIGLGAAIDYIHSIGYEAIGAWEKALLDYATQRVLEIEGVRIVGTAKEKSSVLSIFVEGTHPSDLGSILDQEGVAVRTGHHCAQPVMQHFCVPATLRASFAFINTKAEVDRFIMALQKAIRMCR
jgi:cysteine desulfurase/selenocysteine lyase